MEIVEKSFKDSYLETKRIKERLGELERELNHTVHAYLELSYFEEGGNMLEDFSIEGYRLEEKGTFVDIVSLDEGRFDVFIDWKLLDQFKESNTKELITLLYPEEGYYKTKLKNKG